MKIRSGFVSNSSSSSFIIGCDKIPTSVEEMEELLGYKELSYMNDYQTKEMKVIPSTTVAGSVLSKMTIIKDLNDLEDEDYYCDDDKITYLDVITNDSCLHSPINDIEVIKLNNEKYNEYAKSLNISIEEIQNEIKEHKYFSPLYYYLTKLDIETIEAKICLTKLNENVPRKEQKHLRDEYPELFNRYERLRIKIEDITNKYYSLMSKYNEEQLLNKKYFFTVSYTDENGSYDSAFEHGGTFDNVNVAICSKH